MISAVIFDLDGTILDNEDSWEEAFSRVVTRTGIKVPGGLRQPNGWIHEPGIGLEPNWRRILGGGNVEQERQLAHEVSEEYKTLVAGELFVKPGMVELIGKIKDRGWRTGLATTSFWHVVEDQLEELALQLAFDVTVTGDEILQLKPDPEIFLLAAQKLEVEPGECVVVEDAVGGVRAAVEAGMKAVGLVTDYAPKKLHLAAGAGLAAQDLTEVGQYLDDLAVEPAPKV